MRGFSVTTWLASMRNRSRRPRAGWLLLSVALLASPARSQGGEDEDLDLVPKEVNEAGEAQAMTERPPSRVSARVYLENVATGASAPRALLVEYPDALPRWQDRFSLDSAVRWDIAKRLSLVVSDRLSVIGQEGVSFLSWQTVENNLREGYLSWEPMDRLYLEAGRINVRNGVSLGFNPTDFFRTGTLVGQASMDPSVTRQNRLGVAMVRAQAIWAWGSASLAYAPKLDDAARVVNAQPVGVDPRFYATNFEHRVLLSLNFDVAGLSPQILAYFEGLRPKLGLSASRQLGESVIVYGEWAGGVAKDLSARATEHGQETGVLPSMISPLPPTSAEDQLRNDVSVGAAWTIAAMKLTLNAEYHYHEGGFSRAAWRSWFDAGAGAPQAARQLWYVRRYAKEQQEPLTSHELFVRADLARGLVRDLQLGALAVIDLLDGSTLAQLSANYSVNDAWTVSAFATASLGDRASDYGSLPQALSGSLQLTWYLPST